MKDLHGSDVAVREMAPVDEMAIVPEKEAIDSVSERGVSD
jgi:hypothetical protein